MQRNKNNTFKNGILLNSFLIPKLLNNSCASCFFVNFDFVLPHIAHFDDNTNLNSLHFFAL